MAELSVETRRRVEHFVTVCEELDVLTAEDSDETSLEWWQRLEQRLAEMSRAAYDVAARLAFEERERASA